jgi:hypothetical protein
MVMLDTYLEDLSVDVEPFALCLVDEGWRLTLPGPPVAMLHFIVQGEGWLLRPGRPRERIGPNFLVVIPTGVNHSLETSGEINDELCIDCAPDGPPVHRIKAGADGPVEIVVGCGTLNAYIGKSAGLFDGLEETLVVDLSGIPEVPILYQGLLTEQAIGQAGGPVLQGGIMSRLLEHMIRKLVEDQDRSLPWLATVENPAA